MQAIQNKHMELKNIVLCSSIAVLIACCTLFAQKPKAPSTPEIVLAAFKQGYPDKITETGYDRTADDWYLVANGKRFYWAQGRLLPSELRLEPELWRPYVDYTYPHEIPDPNALSEEDVKQISEATSLAVRESEPPYNQEFYDALYDGKTRRSVEEHITTITFLGKNVSIHEDIVGALKQVESSIYAAAKNDKETQTFIDNLLRTEGYNWREIADSQSRSYHSWGLAIDVLPKGWGQKNLYWNWTSQWNDRWMKLPLSRRWIPPKQVVDIFEKHGFIWGGKWLLWDNMHFEYRPELILLRDWQQTVLDY